MASPKSTSMSSLSAHKKHGGYQVKHYHVSLVVFFVTFLLIWALMWTTQPTFLLKDEHFIGTFPTTGSQQAAKGTVADNTEAKDNKVLSDSGRTAIFLWSLLFAAIITIVHYFVMTRW